MQNLTLEQFKAANSAGAFNQVIIKARGASLFVEATTQSGNTAILTKARSNEPRSFVSPTSALACLQRIGIEDGLFDLKTWQPMAKKAHKRPDRSVALKEAHHAAAHRKWLTELVVESVNDLRPSISHEDAEAIFAKMKIDKPKLK